MGHAQARVKLWPKSLPTSWASTFQNLLAQTNFNLPIHRSIGKICNFLSNTHSFISMFCAFPIYYWNYKYAHWKLWICSQTPKCHYSFPGPVHLEITRTIANLESHGPLGRWIFSPLHKLYAMWTARDKTSSIDCFNNFKASKRNTGTTIWFSSFFYYLCLSHLITSVYFLTTY